MRKSIETEQNKKNAGCRVTPARASHVKSLYILAVEKLQCGKLTEIVIEIPCNVNQCDFYASATKTVYLAISKQ